MMGGAKQVMQGSCYGLEDLQTLLVQPQHLCSLIRLRIPTSVNVQQCKAVFMATAQSPTQIQFTVETWDMVTGRFFGQLVL